MTFSGTPVKECRYPPQLCEHTKEVLATIGDDDAKLAGLRERKVI